MGSKPLQDFAAKGFALATFPPQHPFGFLERQVHQSLQPLDYPLFTIRIRHRFPLARVRKPKKEETRVNRKQRLL